MIELTERLIPAPELLVFPNIRYVDSLDIPNYDRQEAWDFFCNDKEYLKMFEDKAYLNLSNSPISTMFIIYVFKGHSKLGIIKFVEMQNHPEGYGTGDFRVIKLIYPEYRRTKYSRYAAADLIHMLLCSGIAKRCYVYQDGDPNKQIVGSSTFYLDIVDRGTPCASPKLSEEDSDPEIVKFIQVKKLIPTPFGYSIVLYDLDGDIYKQMDLKKYMLSPKGRTEEAVDKWLIEMRSATQKVKENYELINDRNLDK